MNSSSWIGIKSDIEEALDKVNKYFDQDSVDSITHYIEHDEYEMAFEGLFIEIMKLKFKPELNYSKLKETAIQLELDQSSVFDVDFWKKFNAFVDS